VSVVLLIIMWAAGRMFGFNVSLLGSLGMTIALTVILNLVLGAFSSRRRGVRRY